LADLFLRCRALYDGACVHDEWGRSGMGRFCRDRVLVALTLSLPLYPCPLNEPHCNGNTGLCLLAYPAMVPTRKCGRVGKKCAITRLLVGFWFSATIRGCSCPSSGRSDERALTYMRHHSSPARRRRSRA